MIAQTKIDRRAFIAGMGASLALASVPSRDGYALASDATSADGGDPAYEAWKSWRGEPTEGPLALVRAAIVAANAHNTQPWFFRVQPSRIEVMSDTSRNIGTVDPLLREMHIGIGCALENLMLAAAAHGYACKLTLNENDPALAVAELTPAATAKPALFDAIGSRHTNRGTYDTTRAVDADVMNALQQLGDDERVRVIWFSTPADRARFGDVIIQATEAFVADPDQSRDSARWLRNGSSEIEAHRDGLTIYTQGLSPFMVIAARVIPVSAARADQYWLSATRDQHVGTASAFGLIVAPDHRSNVYRMKTGMLWERMQLWATAHGLAMQPLNQPIERAEREESADLPPLFGNALNQLIGDRRAQPLMAFRIGYPTRDPGMSPRRSVQEVVI
jgi:hypothetical protein